MTVASAQSLFTDFICMEFSEIKNSYNLRDNIIT